MGNATLCARVVVEELINRDVREVVLAPGSRSAPLAYELYEADRIGLLRLHVRVDERSAGFTALGLAKASRAPVAVITTSGTAAGNLHPAVMEAWHSHVPLVVLTADRPRALAHTGANQTTNQHGLYDPHLREQATISDAAADPRTWRFEVARLVGAATGARTRLPGPVHLNLELSEPLIPVDLGAVPARAGTVVATSATPSAVTELGAELQTVLVAGDTTPGEGRALAGLAAAAGVPLLAEPSSNARSGAAALSTYRLLLGSTLAEEIERVVVVGHPTLSRPVNRLLSREDVEVVVVSPYADWIDPGRVATLVTDAVAFPSPADPEWLAAWRAAEEELRGRLDHLLDETGYLSGPGLARTLLRGLGDRDTLFIGSSNPVRDCDLAPIAADGPEVYANRGLAGIDGSISTAMGIALAVERPTHALLGDVTAVHDISGLALGPAEPRPDLRVIVANDDGGSIFATLEQGAPAHLKSFERLFATPHGVRFGPLAEAMGHRFQAVGSEAELAEVLAEPPIGVEIVEARVDRAHRRTLDAAITGLAATL